MDGEAAGVVERAVSDAFQQAVLLRIRAEIEAAVSDREAMIAANKDREARGLPPVYDEGAFDTNARAIRAIVPDPHSFS